MSDTVTHERRDGPDDEGERDRPVSELPLPPRPDLLGPPQLYFLQLAADPIRFGRKLREGPDLVRFTMPSQGEIYNARNPDYLKQVLVTERGTFRKTEDFQVAFGEGLLTVEGEEWEQQRDALQPLFTLQSVSGYADGMVEQIRRRTNTWADGDRLDLQAEFTKMTLDVLSATVLGRELALDGDRQLREAAENLHDWFLPGSYVLPTWVPTPARRRFESAKRTIEREAQRLLDEKRGDAPTDPSEADDLLSLLVGLREAGEVDGTFTDERLRDQMVTIIFAGHDTTTTTLTFACWALANHPEVKERFHAEVDALDGPPTMADVETLDVTERVVTETLRLFPPVHTLPRRTTSDVAMGGYRIPEGSRVHVPLMSIQRDGQYFENPDEFRPSRWDGDLRRELHDFAYAPFGGGPRICIGRQFALMEAKLALATIGREYDLYWLGEEGSAPIDLQMTTRMASGEEFLVTER
jgi:cytochrome P450